VSTPPNIKGTKLHWARRRPPNLWEHSSPCTLGTDPCFRPESPAGFCPNKQWIVT
jgi:hypothetical protein